MKTCVHLMIISYRILLRMLNVLDKIYRENKITFYVSVTFCAVYELTWKNAVHPERRHLTKEYSACALHAG
jgi:hypothetical protein